MGKVEMVDRLERGDHSDFYQATFERWPSWKLEREIGYIEVDGMKRRMR